jgi:hypothetical protein
MEKLAKVALSLGHLVYLTLHRLINSFGGTYRLDAVYGLTLPQELLLLQ